MRSNGTLTYLLGDHLGSTSMTTDASGNLISELRYKPWGETRYSSGMIPTQYHYTGQYSYVSDFGLLFYNARWYDSALGRFAQADSIIPGGVQGLDRYAYANNSPLTYTDPSGHCGVSFILNFLFGGSFSCPTSGGSNPLIFVRVKERARAYINV
jgi:RHS repeat-associated protein